MQPNNQTKFYSRLCYHCNHLIEIKNLTAPSKKPLNSDSQRDNSFEQKGLDRGGRLACFYWQATKQLRNTEIKKKE